MYNFENYKKNKQYFLTTHFTPPNPMKFTPKLFFKEISHLIDFFRLTICHTNAKYRRGLNPL